MMFPSHFTYPADPQERVDNASPCFQNDWLRILMASFISTKRCNVRSAVIARLCCADTREAGERLFSAIRDRRSRKRKMLPRTSSPPTVRACKFLLALRKRWATNHFDKFKGPYALSRRRGRRCHRQGRADRVVNAGAAGL